MSWINKNRLLIRISLLMLFALSLTGPWTYDRIHVPVEYTCSSPNIRLEGDFCGLPLSGLWLFSVLIGGFFYNLWMLMTGTFTGQPREFLVTLSLLIPLPFFSTLLLIWRKDSARRRVFNLTVWGLAGGLTLLVFVLTYGAQSIRLWGLWSFTGLAVTTLMLEVLMLKSGPVKGD